MDRYTGWLPILGIFLIAACDAGGGVPDAGDIQPPLDQPLGAGEVRAGVITRQTELLAGPEAHGWLGDFKLYNNKVAFVVEGLAAPRGWGSLGGGVLDAVRLREDGTSLPERFEELFPAIQLLTMQPLTAEVIDDGMIRFTGVHHGIHVVDVATNGALAPYQLALTQEYILEPDAEFLRIRTTVRSLEVLPVSLQVGDVVMIGDTGQGFAPGLGMIGGELPSGSYAYYAGASPDGCVLYAGADGEVKVLISIAGILPIVVGEGEAPVDPLAAPLSVERGLALGEGGIDSCLRVLHDSRGTATGLVQGSLNNTRGEREGGANILAQDLFLPAGQNIVNQAWTDHLGSFELQLPAGRYAIKVEAPGRSPRTSDPIEVRSGETVDWALTLDPPATVVFRCEGEDRDGGGTGLLPCKVTFQEGHDADPRAPVYLPALTFGVGGEGSIVVPEGRWTVTLSRGLEYSIHRESITLLPGDSRRVFGTLRHQVDTSGAIAADFHSHSFRSPETGYDLEDKLASNICEGVELLVLTDHECATDPTPFCAGMERRLGLDPNRLIRVMTGAEISPFYAHMTVFPLPTHPTGWKYWQIPWSLYRDGLFMRLFEFPEYWEHARTLGASIINLAHPLSAGGGFFTYLGFDPPAVMPTLDSLPPERFNRGFDTLELLNGGNVDGMLQRVLPLWIALNNQGLFRTAVGVSDSHHRSDEAGFGRTMIASSSDEPQLLDPYELFGNLRQGQAQVVGGIFIRLSVAGGRDGEQVTTAPPVEVRLQVEAADWVPVGDLRLYENGSVIATFALQAPGVLDPDHPAVRLDESLALAPPRDAWYAAVATGPENQTLDPVIRGGRPVGMTNAVRLDVDGNGRFDPFWVANPPLSDP